MRRSDKKIFARDGGLMSLRRRIMHLACTGVLTIVLSSMGAAQQRARAFILYVPPMENQGSRLHAWLGLAMADHVRDMLSTTDSIAVIGEDERLAALRQRAVDERAKDPDAALVRAGRFLGASAVLVGRYTVRGSAVFIDRRLIDCRTGSTITADSLAGTLPTISDLLERFATSAFHSPGHGDGVRTAPMTLTTADRASIAAYHRPPWTAFEHYARGRSLEAVKPDRAFTHFMKAIQKDGFYTEAYIQAAALCYFKLDDPAQAFEYLRAALVISEQQHAPASMPSSGIAMRIGRLYAAQGDLENALKHYEDSRQRYEKINRQASYPYIVLMGHIGEAHRLRNEYDRAIESLGRAKEIAEQLDLADSEPYAELLARIGTLFYHRERYSRAEDLFARSLAIRTINETEQTPAFVSLLNGLAGIYRQQNNPAKGLRYAEKGEALCRDPRLARTVECAALMSTTGILYYLQQDYAKSVAAHEHGRRILDALALNDNARYAAALYHLGGSYIKTGDRSAAGRCFRTAHDIYRTLGMQEQAEILRPFSEYYGKGTE